MPRLTKALLDRLPPVHADTMIWDSLLPGCGVRRRPGNSHRTFYVQYLLADGTQRKRKLGTYGVVTVEEARAIARQWLVAVARGGDPAATRVRPQVMVAELAARYLQVHALPHKRPKSQAAGRSLIDRHVLPALATLHHQLQHIPVQANRLLTLLSTMLRLAE